MEDTATYIVNDEFAGLWIENWEQVLAGVIVLCSRARQTLALKQM